MTVDPALEEFLALPIMTLATCGQDGAPNAAPVFFAAGDLNLYFFSSASSQHARDLAIRPQAAAAIYPESRGWREIRGLQMRGRGEAVMPGPEWDRAWALYRVKFPFVRALKTVVNRNQMHVFRPNWIRLVDNRLGFGTKREWDLRSGQ